jgi:hypothetical protein
MDPLRAHWGRLIGASVLVLAAAFVAPRFIAAPDLDENRTLAKAPPALPDSWGGLTAYRRAMDAYVADHFPPRALLIGGLNRLRLLIGASGSPRVVVGRDGWLFDDDENHMGAARGVPPLSDAEAQAWLATLAGRTEALAAQGKAYVVLSPPMKAAVYPQMAPAWFRLDANRPAVTLARLSRAAHAGAVLYLHDALAQQAAWGLKTYAAHDTHWTGLGAYLGYAAFLRELQAQGRTDGPWPLEAFREVRIGEVNKPRNLALMLGVASFVHVDYPELADPLGEDTVQTTYLSARHDWTAPHVIDTGQTGKPVLLITVDSFSNALVPFLYSHFSRIVVSHVDDGAWRPDLVARFNPDVVALEVVESGLRAVMSRGPPASPEALARVRLAVAQRQRYAVEPRHVARRAGFHRLDGTDAADRLTGGAGRDDIQGKPGDDTLAGLGGDDALRGGRGADRLDGGDGDDWLSGDRGDDTLAGGRGADTFHGFAGCGSDVVLDFEAEDGDHVELEPGTAYTLRQAGADAVVEMQGGRLILRGVRAERLPPGWIRVRRPPLAQGG